MHNPIIDSTAIVKNTKIGDKTRIWAYTNIYGSEIGTSCTIGAYTEIQNDSKIGNNVIISSHSFICSLVTIKNNVL